MQPPGGSWILWHGAEVFHGEHQHDVEHIMLIHNIQTDSAGSYLISTRSPLRRDSQYPKNLSRLSVTKCHPKKPRLHNTCCGQPSGS